MPWADAIDIGGIELQTYYNWVNRGLVFNAGNVKLTSIAYKAGSLVTKCSFRPGLGFSPYAKLGTAGITLEDGFSGTTWSGTNSARLSGAGINYIAGRDASNYYQVVIDAGINYVNSGLDTMNGGGSPQAIKRTLNLWEIFGSFIFLKPMRVSENVSLAPYGGICLSLYKGGWKDLPASVSYECNSSSILPVAGLGVYRKNAGLKIEFDFSGGGGPGFSAGLCLCFLDN